MSGSIIKTLRATRDADRAQFRRARNRLIRAEASLLEALESWQAEGEPQARACLRFLAQREARAVRRARKSASGIRAALRCADRDYAAAIADEAA